VPPPAVALWAIECMDRVCALLDINGLTYHSQFWFNAEHTMVIIVARVTVDLRDDHGHSVLAKMEIVFELTVMASQLLDLTSQDGLG